MSELTKPLPESRVVEWFGKHAGKLAVSTIVLGELEFGILLLPAGARRRKLEAWFQSGRDRLKVLDFDKESASAWAALVARLRLSGLAMPVKDSLIAACAIAHGLIVATRNTRDFQHAGVPLENPFAP